MTRDNDMNTQIQPKDSTWLTGAWQCSPYGNDRTLIHCDDSYGPLWVYGQEFGPMAVVRAQSWESAYEMVIDELPTIDPSEVPEAHGFYGDNAGEEMGLALAMAQAGDAEWPELQEGYRFQSNCSGTGIVAVGHHEWLRELTREDCARSNERSIRVDLGTEF